MYLTIFELPYLEINSFCSISMSDVMTVAIGCSLFRSLFSILLLQGDEKVWELFMASIEQSRLFSMAYFPLGRHYFVGSKILCKNVSVLKNVFFRCCEEKNLWEQCQHVQIFF